MMMRMWMKKMTLPIVTLPPLLQSALQLSPIAPIISPIILHLYDVDDNDVDYDENIDYDDGCNLPIVLHSQQGMSKIFQVVNVDNSCLCLP